MRGGGGRIAQRILASRPSCPRFVSQRSQIFSEEKIVNVVALRKVAVG